MHNPLKKLGTAIVGVLAAIAMILPAGASATTFIVPQGGTGLSSVTTGALLYGNGTGNLIQLSPGTAGQILQISGGVPHWSTAPASFATTSADYWLTQQTSVPSITTLANLGTVKTSLTGLLKAASGVLSTASAGTDYEVPLTFSTGLTRSTNTVTVNTTQNITNLSNLTSNGFVKTSGGSGALSIDTATYLSSIGSGTNGQLAYWNGTNSLTGVGTSTATCGSGITCSTHTVVGAVAPAFSLDQSFGAVYTAASTTFVNGVTIGKSTTTQATTTNLAVTTLCLTGDTCRTSWPTGASVAGSNGQVQFNSSGSFGADTAFFWDNVGKKLGIGTTTPNNLIDLYSTTKAALGFSGASGSTFKWTIGMDVSNGGRFSIASSTALGTLDRLVIDGNGNVGIGTTAPGALLTVNGTASSTNSTVSSLGTCNGGNAVQTSAGGGLTCGAVTATATIAPLGSDGNDGDVTISSTVTLTRDMYYDHLTVSTPGILKTAGFRVFAKTSVTVNSGGTIQNNGGNGGNGTDSINTSPSGGGTAGAAAPGGTLPAGRAGVAGGDSGGGGGTTGSSGVAGLASTYSLVDWNGSVGGHGGSGAGSGGGGGAAGATSTSATQLPRNVVTAFNMFFLNTYTSTSTWQTYNITAGGSGGGGGGGTGSCSSAGGAGGGSGGSGGVVWIASPTITVNAGGIIQALGGNGGNGGAGAGCSPQSGVGGGGASGNGGAIILIVSNYTNSGTVSAAGGTPGTKGVSGDTTGATDGNTGHAGTIYLLKN